MCLKFAKYIYSHSEMGCCKKICGWLLFTLATAIITIGILSATVYKDKWSLVWVNVIAAECEPNCELESCLVKCDMYVSYKCQGETIYMNYTSNIMDRTYTAGDKLQLDRNNNNCILEPEGLLPLGNIFLYICIGGLFFIVLSIAVSGSIIFVYRHELPNEYDNLNLSETTPLKKVMVVNHNDKHTAEHEMPHIHF